MSGLQPFRNEIASTNPGSAASLKRARGRHRGLASTPSVRHPTPDEYPEVLRWLERGNRQSDTAWIEAEYPLATGPGRQQNHHILWQDSRPIAHALLYPAVAYASSPMGRSQMEPIEETEEREGAHSTDIPVGLVTLVYTEPSQRHRGHARSVLLACEAAARAQGLAAIVLWSDLEEFYRGLGFTPVGVESLCVFSGEVAESAARALPFAGEIGNPRASEWPLIQEIRNRKAVGFRQAAGALERLAAIPGTAFCVAREGGEVTAYAALGRGGDLHGIVHDWAGEPGATLACIAELLRRDQTLHSVALLAGPLPTKVSWQLRKAGARVVRNPSSMVRILDADAIWNAALGSCPDRSRVGLVPNRGADGARLATDTECIELSGSELATFLLGESGTGRVPASLARHLPNSILARLPWPLFAWGFDSI